MFSLRQARSRNQELRDDQDSAYQESLRKDREKAKELELKRESERKEEEAKQMKENEKVMKAEVWIMNQPARPNKCCILVFVHLVVEI